MRMFQKPALEALFGNGLGVSSHAGQQADTGLQQRLGGNLPAREHEIAQRYLFQAPALDHSFIEAFEAAA